MKLQGQFYVLLYLNAKNQQQLKAAPHARCVVVKRSNEQGYLASELMDLRSGAGGSVVIPSTFSERGGESMVLCIFPVFRYKINHPAFSSGFRANN